MDIGPRVIPNSIPKTEIKSTLPENDPAKEEKAVLEILKLLESRKRPVVIIDGGMRPILTCIECDLTWPAGAVRNNFVSEGEALIKLLNVPYFATPMSKGVSERIAGKFGGVYSGGASTMEVKQAVESADLVFYLGNYPVSECSVYAYMVLFMLTNVTRATSIRTSTC